MCVRIRQPRVEREETDLDAESCHEECERSKNDLALVDARQDALHVRHVQRACDCVEVADPEEDERGCNRSHDQVVEACDNAVPAVAHRNQCVGGKR